MMTNRTLGALLQLLVEFDCAEEMDEDVRKCLYKLSDAIYEMIAARQAHETSSTD